jgi:hypothetical protein
VREGVSVGKAAGTTRRLRREEEKAGQRPAESEVESILLWEDSRFGPLAPRIIGSRAWD